MTSIHVSIITPMTRPENFNIIYQSIVTATNGLDMTWEWLITVDAETVPSSLLNAPANVWVGALPTRGIGIYGNIQRTNCKQHVTGNWIKMLDDDNIMHDRYFKILLPIMVAHPDCAIVVNQVNHDGQLRLIAKPENMHVGGVDHDQGIFPTYMLERWEWSPMDYCQDGVLFRTRHYRWPDRFIFVQENLSWYNKLRPDWPKDHIK